MELKQKRPRHLPRLIFAGAASPVGYIVAYLQLKRKTTGHRHGRSQPGSHEFRPPTYPLLVLCGTGWVLAVVLAGSGVAGGGGAATRTAVMLTSADTAARANESAADPGFIYTVGRILPIVQPEAGRVVAVPNLPALGQHQGEVHVGDVRPASQR